MHDNLDKALSLVSETYEIAISMKDMKYIYQRSELIEIKVLIEKELSNLGDELSKHEDDIISDGRRFIFWWFSLKIFTGVGA